MDDGVGVAYADARCLLGFDADDNAVAAITVWSAGPGRPGLIEPMGVHNEHRGHGYATAITSRGRRPFEISVPRAPSSALAATIGSHRYLQIGRI